MWNKLLNAGPEWRLRDRDREAALRKANRYKKTTRRCRICRKARLKVCGITEKAAYHCPYCDNFYTDKFIIIEPIKEPKKERLFKYAFRFYE